MKEQRFFVMPGMQEQLRWLPMVSYAPTGTIVRPLVMVAGQLRQLPDSLAGQGLKPLVMYQGYMRQQVASEGTPVIIDGGTLRTIMAGETLMS